MSGRPAARVGDNHSCPMVDPATSTPHTGGPVVSGAKRVLIGSSLAARIGDSATCVGVPDVIAAGAMPVLVENMPAARQGDKTAHTGVITGGCTSVLIGQRGTTGDLYASRLRCEAMARGRESGSTEQTYGNCGLESCRQIIQQVTGSSVTEDGFLRWATRGLWAGGLLHLRWGPNTGGTTAWDEAGILNEHGIETTLTQVQDIADLRVPSAQGRGMIVGVDAHFLPWRDHGAAQPEEGSWHSVLLTGIEYDDDGEVVAYWVNDTGVGVCGMRVKKDAFEEARQAFAGDGESGTLDIAITDRRVW